MMSAFAILALFMARNHSWTDKVMAEFPLPGPATSLAADPGLAGQIRIGKSRAWYTTLVDRTSALIAEAEVVNDAILPVTNIVVEAHAYQDGSPVRTISGMCGLPVSNRLLQRLPREELGALLDLEPPFSTPLGPGQSMDCQVAFAGLEPGADEVVFRVASAEPVPGHSKPLFHRGQPQE
jgi:hypothetical protein